MNYPDIYEKAKILLPPILRWAKASAPLRKRCERRPRRWRPSREEPGKVHCSLCGRTALDPEFACYPLVADDASLWPPIS